MHIPICNRNLTFSRFDPFLHYFKNNCVSLTIHISHKIKLPCHNYFDMFSSAVHFRLQPLFLVNKNRTTEKQRSKKKKKKNNVEGFHNGLFKFKVGQVSFDAYSWECFLERDIYSSLDYFMTKINWLNLKEWWLTFRRWLTYKHFAYCQILYHYVLYLHVCIFCE